MFERSMMVKERQDFLLLGGNAERIKVFPTDLLNWVRAPGSKEKLKKFVVGWLSSFATRLEANCQAY